MKTISDLGRKWSYRLLKVLCFCIAGSIALFAAYIAVDAYAPKFDIKNSYIQCRDGKKISSGVNNTLLYSEFVDSYQDERFRAQCAATIVRSEDGTTRLLPSSFIPDEKNYDVIAIYIPRDWTRTVGYSLLFIFVVLLIVELLKRIFYYITLGRMRPPKS